jgi:2-polyprenyl-6-methoxyphenol hydroxylase-like FAD-dependent oxidoreductase
MDVAIVGGGICGLSLALNLKERAIDCRIYERAPEIKPLGVGITLLPHAMREFSVLGLDPAIWSTSSRLTYEATRVAPAAKVVRNNREQLPDFINIKVEELISVTSRSTISTNTLRSTNCARCRKTTSASPASRSPM